MPELAAFLFTVLVSAGIPGLLAIIALSSWRRLPEEPWTERARELQPIRTGHSTWLFLLPFTAVVARLWFFPEVSAVTVLIAAVIGGILSSWPLDRAIFPDFSFSRWLKAATLVSGRANGVGPSVFEFSGRAAGVGRADGGGPLPLLFSLTGTLPTLLLRSWRENFGSNTRVRFTM